MPRIANIVRTEGPCVIFGELLNRTEFCFLQRVFSLCCIRNNIHAPQAMLLPGLASYRTHQVWCPSPTIPPAATLTANQVPRVRRWRRPDPTFAGMWLACPTPQTDIYSHTSLPKEAALFAFEKVTYVNNFAWFYLKCKFSRSQEIPILTLYAHADGKLNFPRLQDRED